MTDEATLREKARETIRCGALPDLRPDATWGGPGSGADCTICRAAVEPHEAELELEFAGAGADGGRVTYHVHARCFAVWEFERESAELGFGVPDLNRRSWLPFPASVGGIAAQAGSAAAGPRRSLSRAMDDGKILGRDSFPAPRQRPS